MRPFAFRGDSFVARWTHERGSTETGFDPAGGAPAFRTDSPTPKKESSLPAQVLVVPARDPAFRDHLLRRPARDATATPVPRPVHAVFPPAGDGRSRQGDHLQGDGDSGDVHAKGV